MVHRIFTFTEAKGIDLWIDVTTDSSYKGNTAYMRVWHQFRAEYDE